MLQFLKFLIWSFQHHCHIWFWLCCLFSLFRLWFLPLSMPYNFCWKVDMLYWLKGTAVNRPLVMWWVVGKANVFCCPGIRSQSFSEPVPLRWELDTRLPVPHLLRWDRRARMGPSWWFLFPQVYQALIKSQQVKLWYFSIEQVLLRRSECSGVFQNGSFAPSPAGNKGIFFSLHSPRSW